MAIFILSFCAVILVAFGILIYKGIRSSTSVFNNDKKREYHNEGKILADTHSETEKQDSPNCN